MSDKELDLDKLKADLNKIVEPMFDQDLEAYIQMRYTLGPARLLDMFFAQNHLARPMFLESFKSDYYQHHAKRLGLGAAGNIAITKN